MRKIFYRVENPKTQNGLWYDIEGNFTGIIHRDEFNMLQNHKLPMPFNKDIQGWLSCVEKIEEIEAWFNKDDMMILRPKGYVLSEYESTDFKKVDGHWIMKREASKIIRLF